MNFNFIFFFNSILLGIGLSMDAFSISMANGLTEPDMHKSKVITIAGIFAFFQALMPMIGWMCVHTIAQHFSLFEKCVPYIALILLLIIGGKMLKDGLKGDDENIEKNSINMGLLVVQGIATAIDALSVGFTISHYNSVMAVVCSLIIALVTFFICYIGVLIGKSFGTRLSNKAQILGGLILIFIGIEIFVKGII